MTWHLIVLNGLIHAALGGTVFLLAGCLAVRWCRQPVRRVRLIELTLIGSLLVPLVSHLPWLPHWSAGLLALEPAPAAPPACVESSPPVAAGERLPEFGPPPSAGFAESVVASSTPGAGVGAPPGPAPEPEAADLAAPASSIQLPPWPWLVVIAYGVVVGLLLVRLLAGLAFLARLRWTAYPAPQAAIDLLREIAGPASARVRLLVSDSVEVPLALPGWRPIILLPGALSRDSDPAVLRYGLAHEWSHIERGDLRRWYLATLAQFLFFYQPLFWWLRGQLRLCQDYLADARAAAQSPEAEDYAAYLVGLARRQLGVPAGALGISDRRTNLYRRVTMLLQTREPLEQSCLKRWGLVAGLAAFVLLAICSVVRLDAGAAAVDEPEKPAKEEPKDKPAEKGETLKYTGKVTDKDTGKPVAGARVTVRRSLYGDPEIKEEDRIMEESKHTTDADGKYQLTIPPEQSSKRYLYIELDVEHPEYAPRKGFGYALSMIRKNEKLGGRPFFEHVELRPGKAITGQLLTPEGKPAPGVKVLAYSRTTKKGEDFEYGSFADTRTDAEGRFRLVLTTPGSAVFWILPEKYVPSTHAVKEDKRGDLGTFTLANGISLKGKVVDAKGKPLAGVYVNADGRRNEALQGLPVADHISRSALTNDKGEFEMAPLPPGTFEIQPGEHARDSSRDRDRTRRPVPAVFVAQKFVLKEGEEAEPIEVRAVPHVTIEAQFYDSKGKPTRGHAPFIFGQVDRTSWHSMTKIDPDGKVTVHVPHGLENVRLSLSTNEHGVLRWRKTKDAPLSNSREINLGTVNDDVKGIEIVRYVAPILVVNAVDKDKRPIKGFKVQAVYSSGKSPKDPDSTFVNGVRGDVYFEKQEDGRWRTNQMLPDEEVEVTVSADGYASQSTKVKLPEGEVKELELVLEKK